MCLHAMLAPKYYEQEEGDSDPEKFVKKMGDSMALNEADIDLGPADGQLSRPGHGRPLGADVIEYRHAGCRDGQ